MPSSTNNTRSLTCIYTPETQTLGNQKIKLKENHPWEVETGGNVKEYHSLGQAALRFGRTAEGLFRWGQLWERGPKFVNATLEACGKSPLGPLENSTEIYGGAWRALTTIPHAITMTPAMIRAVKGASEALNDSSQTVQQKRYKFEQATFEVFDTAAMYAYSASNVASLFPRLNPFCSSLIKFGEGTTLVHDAASLKINTDNYLHARSVDLTHATQNMKETVEGTRKYALVAIAKDVSSVAAGFFGMLSLIMGISVLPAVAFAALSLASTVFAVIKKMNDETMAFEPIRFLDHRNVALITA